MKIKWKNFILKNLEIDSCVFILVLTFVMLKDCYSIWCPKYYSDILLDRTSTNDHLLDFIGFLALFCFSCIYLRKPFIALMITSFVFGIGNLYADQLILHYNGLGTYDYITPILSAIVLIYFLKKRYLKWIVLFCVFTISYYILWVFLKIPIDGIPNESWQWDIANNPYFFNPIVNFWIICVWCANFILGFLLLTIPVYKEFNKQRFVILFKRKE